MGDAYWSRKASISLQTMSAARRRKTAVIMPMSTATINRHGGSQRELGATGGGEIGRGRVHPATNGAFGGSKCRPRRSSIERQVEAEYGPQPG